ncbi:MAG: ribosome-associated translation inhibitor RaiA [Clostridia bacterium]|nr:ribosome-associated translation inhibitor RaiA [Clostridia bacterium]MBR6754854.1 ribosome-associated translation inhibitor RaiA [Clostridia bacterium]
MKIRIITKKFTLTDDVREWVEKKLAKFDKFFSEDTEATVALMSTKIGERVEVTIYRNGSIFRSEIADKDYKCALDTAMENIERQIRKNRTRLEKKLYVKKEAFENETIPETEEELSVVKTKKFEMRAMTVDEAILQMNLLQHSFYMFLNSETGIYNVVYQRADGGYGVIEPLE